MKAIHCTGGLCTLNGIGKKPVFTTDNKGTNGIFRAVIGNGNITVFEETVMPSSRRVCDFSNFSPSGVCEIHKTLFGNIYA